MIKFFRQHNRRLLAIFVSLLLVAWLAGSALTDLLTPKPGRMVLAKSEYGTITRATLDEAESATRIMSMIGLPWQRLGREPLDVTEWVLLEQEARRLCMPVTFEDARTLLAHNGLNEAVLSNISVQHNVSQDSIIQAAARHFTVQQAVNAMLVASAPSEAEIQTAARDELEKASIRAVVLKASPFVDAAASFTDAELQPLFDQYKSRPAGAGLAFGYQIPPHARMEYLKIDVRKIAAAVAIGDKTLETRAKKYWLENKQNPAFRRPDEPKVEAPQPTEATDAEKKVEGESAKKDETAEKKDNAAEKKDEPAKPLFFETYEEARTAAIEQVRKEFAVKAARELAATLNSGLLEPWLHEKLGDDGYRATPAGVAAPDYLKAFLATQPTSVRYLDAVSIHSTESFDSSQAPQQTDIGRARVSQQGGGKGNGFATVAFNVQGIARLDKNDKQDRSMYVAVHQPYPVAFEDATEDFLFVIRPTAAEAAREPKDLNEVRERVTTDLRTKRAFEAAKQHAQELAKAAESGGLQAAWDAAAELQLLVPDAKPTTPPAFPREGFRGFMSGATAVKGLVSGVGMVDDTFINSVFGLAEKPANKPRITTIEMSEIRDPQVVVAEWIEVQPVTTDEFKKQRAAIAKRLQQDRVQKAVAEWLSPDKIRERAGFTLSQG